MTGLVRASILALAISGLIAALLAPTAHADDEVDPLVAAAAGEYYLSVICGANAARDRFAAAAIKAERRGWELGDKPTKAMRRTAKKASRVYGQAGRKLVQYDWPATVAYDAQTVAEELYSDASTLGAIARGGRSWSLISSSAASRLRLALGLGPNNTDFDGCSN